ncbi:MAG: hypothetical protein H6Q90_635 [Deltaproteobacteria bacterium]|nr:hypothetical protein [Deltaproteobacteria bacterium]
MTNPTDANPPEPASGTSPSGEPAMSLDELTERAKQHAASLVKDLTVLMRRYPLATVAVGLAAGYLVARLLHRR